MSEQQNETDKVMHKIRSLMQKTVENGASESEAFAAINIVKTLMDKHGLSEDDIKSHKFENSDFIFGSNNTKRNYRSTIFERMISASISKYTGVLYKCVAYESGNKNKSSMTVFFGHKIDVELAVYMLNMCNNALKNEWARYAKATGSHGNGIKEFSIGMAYRIGERLMEMSSAETTEKSSATGNSLVVLKRDLVISKINELYPDENFEKPKTNVIKYDKSKEQDMDYGYNAGDSVELNRKVDNGSKIKKIGV